MAGVDKVPPEEFAACLNTLIISLSSSTSAVCKSLKEPSFPAMPEGHVGELLPWQRSRAAGGQRGDEPQPRSRSPARPPCKALRDSVRIKPAPAPGVATRPGKVGQLGPAAPALGTSRRMGSGFAGSGPQHGTRVSCECA